MVGVTINGNEYSIFNEWEDITINKSIEIYKLISVMPPKLRELYECATQDDLDKVELDDDDMIRRFPTFYGQVLEVCGDIPNDVIKHTSSSDRRITYKTYLESMVIGLMYLPQNLRPVTEFEFNKIELVDDVWTKTDEIITYYLPKSKDVLGHEKIGAYMTALEFTESSDLEFFSKGLEGGKYEYSANIISVLARPLGEDYNEDISLGRAEFFKELKMDVCLGVFFSLITSLSTSMSDMVISSLPQESELRKPLIQLISSVTDGMVV